MAEGQEAALPAPARGPYDKDRGGPHARGVISVAKQKSRVDGTYELHFGMRNYGHYIWYVNGQTRGQPWYFKADPVKANC